VEEFVAEWILEDIAHKIDHKQFGVTEVTSTTLCLLDMFHNWLLNLDTPGQYLRICFLDFARPSTASTLTFWLYQVGLFRRTKDIIALDMQFFPKSQTTS
jgi:hypothetical protein